MSNPPPASEESFNTNRPARGRWKRFVNGLLVLGLLAGVGIAAGVYYLKAGDASSPVVEYEKPDESQAAKAEAQAKEQVADDQKAVNAARELLKAAKAKWDAARATVAGAMQARDQAEPTARAKAEEDLQTAERLSLSLKSTYEAAQEKFITAQSNLKAADQRLAAAEAERQRVADIAARQEQHRLALLGQWTRPDYYGQLTLDLKDDGTGTMSVQFEGKYAFLVAKTLEVDIEWEVIGDHVIFNSLRGRPAGAFKFVTGFKGRRRDQILLHVDAKLFRAQDFDEEKKIKEWKRLPG